MSKLEEAKEILSSLKVPAKQQNGMCCCVLLAMANLTEEQAWGSAANNWIRIHDVIAFANSNYGTTYAENSRETFRKQAMHHFRNAAFIEDNGKATNSPNYRYRLTDEMLRLIQSFGTANWERSLARFMENHDSLVDLYASKRTMRKMPVKINGEDFTFSPGKHNQLQKAIIEEFAPRFAPNSECLYVGDTTEKDLVKNVDKLRALGFEITLHDKMPDVVLYSEDKDWLYFIESVTSVGPMEPKRIKEIKEMTTGVTAGKIYVTAFLDFKTFKQFSESLAWETEVWIADMPDHILSDRHPNLYDYYFYHCKNSTIRCFDLWRVKKLAKVIAQDSKAHYLYFMYLCEMKRANYMAAFAYYKNYFDRVTADLDFAAGNDPRLKKPNYNMFYREGTLIRFYSGIDDSKTVIEKAHKLRNANPLSHASSELLDSNNTSKDLCESIKALSALIYGYIDILNEKL